LDLEKVEACFLFIEGAGIADNVNLVYDKQVGKNKKLKKQLNKYVQELNDKKESKKLSASTYVP